MFGFDDFFDNMGQRMNRVFDDVNAGFKKAMRHFDQEVSQPAPVEPLWKCTTPVENRPGYTYNEKSQKWESIHPPYEKIIYKIDASSLSEKVVGFSCNYQTLEDATADFINLRKSLKNFENWFSPDPKRCKETFVVTLTNIDYLELVQIKTVYAYCDLDRKYKVNSQTQTNCAVPNAVYDEQVCKKKKKKS